MRLVTVLLALAAAGCVTSPPAAIALPNGYYIERDKRSQPQIVKRSGRTVLQGPIAAYSVYRQWVIGAVGHWPPRGFAYPNELPFPGSDDARYFMLDTASGELRKDLSKDAWRKELEQRGAAPALPITAPVLPQETRRAG
jgi:hypothetical protein